MSAKEPASLQFPGISAPSSHPDILHFLPDTRIRRGRSETIKLQTGEPEMHSLEMRWEAGAW